MLIIFLDGLGYMSIRGRPKFVPNFDTWILQNRERSIILHLILYFLCLKSMSLPYPQHIPSGFGHHRSQSIQPIP